MTTPLDPNDLNYLHYAGMSSDQVQADIDRRLNDLRSKHDEMRQMQDEFLATRDPKVRNDIDSLQADIDSRIEVISAGERLLQVWPATSATPTPIVDPLATTALPTTPSTTTTTPAPSTTTTTPPTTTPPAPSPTPKLKKAATFAVAGVAPWALASKKLRKSLGFKGAQDPVGPEAESDSQKPFWTPKKVVLTAAGTAAVVYGASVVAHSINDDAPVAPQDQSGQVQDVPTPIDRSCDLTDEAARTEADKTIEALGTEDRQGAVEIAKADLLDQFGEACTSDELVRGQDVAEQRIDEVLGTRSSDSTPGSRESESTTSTTEPQVAAEPDAEIYCETGANGQRQIDYHGVAPAVQNVPSSKWEGRACDTLPGQQIDITAPGGEVIREIGGR